MQFATDNYMLFPMLGVISNGGAKPNIIPEFTELQYMIRAPTDPELVVLKAKFEACVHGAAQATGCTVSVLESQLESYKM